jgi:hypothetical protein
MISPWDEPIPASPIPVADDLANDEPMSLSEEAAVWQSRAHLLWVSAVKDGNLNAQASALSCAFKSLQNRIALEESDRAQEQNTEHASDGLSVEQLDGLVHAELGRRGKVCSQCAGAGYLRKENDESSDTTN